MARINSRTKGQTGEREMARWLKLNLKLEHEPQRCLEQVRFGGAGRIQQGFDLVGCQPFAVEVKRQEKLSLRSWWMQIVNSATEDYPHPVVAFRQNRGKWRFLISARNIGLERGFLCLEEREAKEWMIRVLEHEAMSDDSSQDL